MFKRKLTGLIITTMAAVLVFYQNCARLAKPESSLQPSVQSTPAPGPNGPSLVASNNQTAPPSLAGIGGAGLDESILMIGPQGRGLYASTLCGIARYGISQDKLHLGGADYINIWSLGGSGAMIINGKPVNISNCQAAIHFPYTYNGFLYNKPDTWQGPRSLAIAEGVSGNREAVSIEGSQVPFQNHILSFPEPGSAQGNQVSYRSSTGQGVDANPNGVFPKLDIDITASGKYFSYFSSHDFATNGFQVFQSDSLNGSPVNNLIEPIGQILGSSKYDLYISKIFQASGVTNHFIAICQGVASSTPKITVAELDQNTGLIVAGQQTSLSLAASCTGLTAENMNGSTYIFAADSQTLSLFKLVTAPSLQLVLIATAAAPPLSSGSNSTLFKIKGNGNDLPIIVTTDGIKTNVYNSKWLFNGGTHFPSSPDLQIPSPHWVDGDRGWAMWTQNEGASTFSYLYTYCVSPIYTYGSTEGATWNQVTVCVDKMDVTSLIH